MTDDNVTLSPPPPHIDAAIAQHAPRAPYATPYRAVMVRIPTPTYRRMRMAAAAADMSVTAYVTQAVDAAVGATDAMETTAA